MKRCPECRRDYYDDTLSFCLDDGSQLLDGPASGLIVLGEPETAILPAIFADAGTLMRDFDRMSTEPTISMSGADRTNSIAVMPFVHLSSDPDDEYFCDGLAEELINALSRIDGLKVVARTSAFSFKGKNVDITQIGQFLNVGKVVEGSVRKSGDRMRISVQLIDTADGYNVWSGKYDTEMRDIFDVQDEITFSVVKALKTKLLDKPEGSVTMSSLIGELKQHAHDVEAYKLYLRARFFFNKFTPEGFWRAAECFEQAIEIDPNFAGAYAGLADVHVFLTEFGPVPSLEGMPKAKEAALKAISLDPDLSEAHSSLALVLQEFDFDFVQAEAEYKVAIELNPNNSMAYQYYGSWLAQMGQFEKAETMCLKSIELDPISPMGSWIYPFVLFLSRRYDDAIVNANKLLELDRDFSAAFLVLSFAHSMRSDFAASVEAYARFLELCGLPEVATTARKAFESDGWPGFLRAMTGSETRTSVSSYINSVHFATLDDTESALQSLKESFDKREGFLVMLNVDPRFDDIRSDARFQRIIDTVGFPSI